MALIEKLEAIGDAIRAKTGGTELLTLDAMPQEIESIETSETPFTEEDLTFTGNIPDYTLSDTLGTKIVDLYGNLISFIDVSRGAYLFANNTADLDGITINIKNMNFQNFMRYCLTNKLPKLVGSLGTGSSTYSQYLFSGLRGISEFPNSFYEGVDWSTGALGMYYAFDDCQYLRTAPIDWIKSIKLAGSSSYSGYQGVFNVCRCLDEVINYPVNNNYIYTSNIMSGFIAYNYRLSNLTFETNEDGTPIVAQWKSQNLDLSGSIGYGSNAGYFCVSDISGITADKEVTDDATYQALKNDPDWFTSNINYSRYNHDSAVNTINSLPDTSAYLATAGGTNTIKFKGDSGAKTDGGAINTLTEEEIAVAAAKGWTITLV